MQLTRKQIIQYLRENHYATANELSKSLNVTPANIRHHLSDLFKQGAIEYFGKILPQGRGRPTRLYRLSNAYLDNNLAHLSAILLRTILDDLSNEQTNQMYHIAKKMLGEFDINPNLFHRLNKAIKWLNDRHYKSRWEASPTGPRVILGFCPYIPIIESNPEICRLDRELISLLIQLQVTQIEKMERSPTGPRQCIFISDT
jgi:predicted ArsR family transcriptional regulator